MDKTYQILIDSREKLAPLIFPTTLQLLDPTFLPSRRLTRTVTLTTEIATLPTGDYLLRGYEDCMIVERKKDANELQTNCLTLHDRPRFVRCLDRLVSSCCRPVLLLESTPFDLFRPTRHCPDPHLAIDALQRLLLEHRIELCILPLSSIAQRRAAGEWVARLLLNAALTRDILHANRNQPIQQCPAS